MIPLRTSALAERAWRTSSAQSSGYAVVVRQRGFATKTGICRSVRSW